MNAHHQKRYPGQRAYEASLSVASGLTFRRLGIYLLLACLCATLHMYQQTMVENAGKKISVLREQRDRLKNLNEFTRADIDQLSRFAQFEQIAKKQLNMNFPDNAPVTLIVPPVDRSPNLIVQILDFITPDLRGASR